jgi:hypothetical protein
MEPRRHDEPSEAPHPYAYHYVRQEVECRHIQPKYVASCENPADGFTKPLMQKQFAEWVTKLGMEIC